ncbi:hypothetical protein ACP70R_037231 [Stipagrostis hirtigluma subsp. patula]
MGMARVLRNTAPLANTNARVYLRTADLVEGVLQGRNGTVFCYGATGAGKTYTMLGTMENPGVMVLAIKDLFSKVTQRSHDNNHSIQLCYVEVYNEMVRDLLSPGRPILLNEDTEGIDAAGLTLYRAYSTDEVIKLLQQGNQNRTTKPPRESKTAPRSHAVLQVVVEYGSMYEGNMVTSVGKLSLVDLPGPEIAHATDQHTQRLIEGANINRSLLALNSCIDALVEGEKPIPYRNSKLTQILKDSLGRSCNTVIIANIGCSNLSLGETHNTLRWASRAKEIKPKEVSATNEEVVRVPDYRTDQANIPGLQKENSESHRKAKANAAKEEAVNVTDSETVQAKLPLELQKGNIVLEANKAELQWNVKTLNTKIEKIVAAAQAQGCERLLQFKHKAANGSEADKGVSLQKEQRVAANGSVVKLPQDLRLCTFDICAIEGHILIVYSEQFRHSICFLPYRRDVHGVDRWGRRRVVPLKSELDRILPGQWSSISELDVLAVRDGYVYLVTSMYHGPQSPCWFISLCLKTMKLEKLFQRAYDNHMHPYIMAWPSSLYGPDCGSRELDIDN